MHCNSELAHVQDISNNAGQGSSIGSSFRDMLELALPQHGVLSVQLLLRKQSHVHMYFACGTDWGAHKAPKIGQNCHKLACKSQRTSMRWSCT